MRNIWFTSDQHYGHENILKFTDKNNKLIRGSIFNDVDHMNNEMINRHNSVVNNGDYVYHLGDFAWSAQIASKIIPQLKGSHRLIVGNHDDIKRLSPLFKKVQMWRHFKEQSFVCTHVPIRPKQFPNGIKINVHGHLHQNLVDIEERAMYYNACVEHHDYTPVHMDTIIKYVRNK